MLDIVKARIQEMEKAIEASAANHNALVGALQEAKNIYHLIEKEMPVIEQSLDEMGVVVSDL